MLLAPGSIKIFFCTSAMDMRMNFNGLYGIVKTFMNGDPMSGNLFVFRNRRGNRLKILVWDRDGFVLWYKLLSKGTFRFPETVTGKSIEIDYPTLMMILDGIDLKSVRRQKRYQHKKDALKTETPPPDFLNRNPGLPATPKEHYRNRDRRNPQNMGIDNET